MFKTIAATAKKLFSSQNEADHTGPVSGSFEYFLEMAEGAWPLTEEALASSGIPEVADRCHGRKRASFRQSPLHRIMNAFHTSLSAEIRHRLQDDANFKQCVAHVFSRVSRESVARWSDFYRGHGYYEPMVAACDYALENNFVGLSYDVVWDQTPSGPSSIYYKYSV